MMVLVFGRREIHQFLEANVDSHSGSMSITCMLHRPGGFGGMIFQRRKHHMFHFEINADSLLLM